MTGSNRLVKVRDRPNQRHATISSTAETASLCKELKLSWNIICYQPSKLIATFAVKHAYNNDLQHDSLGYALLGLGIATLLKGNEHAVPH